MRDCSSAVPRECGRDGRWHEEDPCPFACTGQGQCHEPTWQLVGSAGFSDGVPYNNAIAVAGVTPYVAFWDGAHDQRLTVMRFGEAAWQPLGGAGVFEGASTTRPSLAISGGRAYVAYVDEWTVDGAATVARYDASEGTWSYLGNRAFSQGPAAEPSLAFAGSTPYVAFRDDANEGKATTMSFSGSAWVNVGPPAFSPGAVGSVSLALSGTTPYVAFRDATAADKVTVMTFNGSAWVHVGGAAFSEDAVSYVSLSFGGTTPYVAFSDAALDGRATVMRFNGSTWENVGQSGFSSGAAYFTSLAFVNTTPYVAYLDVANDSRATVMRLNGNSWETVGPAGFTDGGSYEPSFAISDGTPYVAFRGDDGKATVMKFE